MREPPYPNIQQIEYRHFWEFIAKQIGDSRLTLNHSATKVENFMQLDCDPKNCLRSVSIESYKRSKCKNLNSPVDLNVVLDVLGETAYSLRGQSRDDLFDIELLEEVAWHIANRYSSLIHIEQPNKDSGTQAKILSFPDYRIRRANSRL